MSFPLFSAIREGLENVKNSLDAIQTAVNGQTNTINVSGGGSTQWAGVVDLNETITIAQGLDFIRGDLIYYKSSDTSHSFQALSLGRGDSHIDGNISTRLLANGDFTIEATFEQLDVVISFTSYPMMTGGIVGPQGPQGPEGAPGVADLTPAWVNLTLGPSWSNYGSPYPDAQYAVLDQTVFLRGRVTCTDWANNQLICTLPASAFPTYRVRAVVAGDNTHTDIQPSIIIRQSDGEIRIMVNTGAGSGSLALDNVVYFLN